MLYFKDVPVVIEPGVGALEVGLVTVKDGEERLFFVPFERVTPTSENSHKLPLIMSSMYPHIFSMTRDLEQTPFLLVYNNVGKLSFVYTRDKRSYNWEKNEASPEQVGDTVTQFSVRFSFKTAKNRDVFMRHLDEILAAKSSGKRLPQKKVGELFELLMAANDGPVMLPVAVAKKAAV
jgi:hypothetical protein